MTNESSPPIPAGWYPDPEGDPRPRWWDGTRWTAQYAEPYSQATTATALRAPEGTVTGTPWIWLIVFIPLLGLIPLFTVDWIGNVLVSIENPTDPAAAFAIYSDPGFLAAIPLSLLLQALTVLFAWLAHRALVRNGVPRPFHWAWAFFTLAGAGNLVYVIGRSVVVRRRTGGGLAPLWATIAINVAIIIGAIVWSVWFVTEMVALIPPTGLSG